MMERPHDWRVFWNEKVHLWQACRWDDIGGTCRAKDLDVRAPFDTVGPFLRFRDAEAKIGTLTWIMNENLVVDVLRLVPLTQVVSVDAIMSGIAARGPR